MPPLGDPRYNITCHCGACRQTVVPCAPATPTSESTSKVSIVMCYRAGCRHMTGVLCTSYLPIDAPFDIDPLRIWQTSPTEQHLFCRFCGCHVFRRHMPASGLAEENAESCGCHRFWTEREPATDGCQWEVATGVIEGPVEAGADTAIEFEMVGHITTSRTETRHDGTSKTFKTDNGAYLWFACAFPPQPVDPDSLLSQPDMDIDAGPDTADEATDEEPSEGSSVASDPGAHPGAADVLRASCRCKTMSFHITRPNASSFAPASPFPDLLIPYHTGSDVRARAEIANPGYIRWWLCPAAPGTGATGRYLAGTCACPSCRLTSGFEIQPWAFVPRNNIFMHVRGNDGFVANIPLDVDSLEMLGTKKYKSSNRVTREFCPRCGATVCYANTSRPNVIAISAGLFKATEGARAESWLNWCTGRVSFAEEVETGRTGQVARCARNLIAQLETGLRVWGSRQQAESAQAGQSRNP